MSEVLFGMQYATLYDLAQALAAAKPPVAPPPPVADVLVPHLPSGMFHDPPPQKYPYDMVRQSKMGKRSVPWTLPYVSPGVLAASKNGAKPTRQYRFHLFGAPNYLYTQMPNFTNGKSDPMNKEFGDDLVSIAKWEAAYPNVAGPRGIGRPDPYCSVISHPPVDLAGAFNSRLPLAIGAWHNRDIGGLYADGRTEIWGRIPRLAGVPADIPLYQTCANKADRTIMYAAELGSGIIRIDRAQGKAGNGKTEDPSQYAVSMLYPGSWPTSVDTHTDGSVWYVDNGYVYKNGAKWLLQLNIAFALVVDSPRGRLLVLSDRMDVSSFDLTSGVQQWGTSMQPGVASPLRGTDFFTIDVDENGTCGPAGTIRVTRVHTGGNTNLWEITPDGKTVTFGQRVVFPSMQGWNVCGDIPNVHEWFGHYAWVNHYHRFQGLYFTGGYADTLLSVVACDPPLPASGSLDYRLVFNGMSAFCEAGLTSVCSVTGESPYAGCSYDEMAELSCDAILSFLVGGMITETPRPDLQSAKGIMAVCAICANSQRAMREGKPFLDSVFAWAQSRGLKPTDYPGILNGGHMCQSFPVYYETDGKTIVPTDDGRSTPIRNVWPPVNRLNVPVPADAQIVVDSSGERPVAYVKNYPSKARIL